MPRVVLVLLVVAAAVAGAWRYLRGGNTAEPGVLRVSGNIEVTDAQVGFKIAGRVEKRPVDEGHLVRAGDVIAELDTADLKCDVAIRAAEVRAAEAALAELLAGSRKEEIAAAGAAVDKARALLDELKSGSRPQEVSVAEAAVATALAEKARLETELGRANSLRRQNVVTAEQYDQAKTAYDVAVAKVHEATERLDLVREGPRKEQIAQAQAALAQAQAQADLVNAGPRAEDIEQARARLQQAAAALQLAQTRLGYAVVTAPMDGVVLSKNIEPGEYVAPGTPVVTVADLKNIWLRGYVPQGAIDRIRVGLPARVSTAADGRSYEGRVSFIASEAEFTPKTVQTDVERVKLVYRVKIDVQNPQMQLKPGVPADAAIDVD